MTNNAYREPIMGQNTPCLHNNIFKLARDQYLDTTTRRTMAQSVGTIIAEQYHITSNVDLIMRTLFTRGEVKWGMEGGVCQCRGTRVT